MLWLEQISDIRELVLHGAFFMKRQIMEASNGKKTGKQEHAKKFFKILSY